MGEMLKRINYSHLTFELEDSNGDGLCCGHGEGSGANMEYELQLFSSNNSLYIIKTTWILLIRFKILKNAIQRTISEVWST